MTNVPQISYSISEIPIVRHQERWKLQRERAALLVHDYQNFFIGFLDPKLQTELIEATNLIIDKARYHNVPIVFSGQAGYGDRLERGIIRDLWGKGMSSLPAETAIDSRVHKSVDDFSIVKQRYSAFSSTNLESLLRAARRDQLIICGVYGSVGITATAYDCVNKDIQSFLVPDAIADFSAQQHQRTLELLSNYSSDLLYTTDLDR